MSIFIVGDVHGNYKSLTSSLEKSGCDVNADTIIFVGDVVDRGKEKGDLPARLIRAHLGTDLHFHPKHCPNTINLHISYLRKEPSP